MAIPKAVWKRVGKIVSSRQFTRAPERRPKRKPTPPRCARQPLPREGARVDTPSFLWKEVPRRGGGWMGGSGMKKSGKIVSSAPFARVPYPPLRGPPSPMGKAAIREHRYPHIVRANTCMCGKTIPPAKPSPRGEGGEQSEPDRVLAA